MALTATWKEDWGPATGSPPRGTVSQSVSNINWKNIGDGTSTPEDYPIPFPTVLDPGGVRSSFDKYNWIQFTGSYSLISSGKWAHTAGEITGSLTGNASRIYAEPSSDANLTLSVNMTTPISVSAGQVVLFGNAPYSATATNMSAGTPSTQYLISQINIFVATATIGASPVQTISMAWTEA